MGWNERYKLSPDWPNPVLGAGISRPLPRQRTRPYRMEAARPGSPVMRVTIPAPSKAKAISYCQHRWPDCDVTPIQ